MLEATKLSNLNILNSNNHLNGINSSFISSNNNSNNSNNNIIYGELVILGYNGSLAQGDKGRRKSKFTLFQRPSANGIKKNKHYVVQKPAMTRAIQDKAQHSISYTLSRNQAVIVEYTSCDEKDMFQIGRSSETPIDFIVIDTPTNDKSSTDQSNKQNDHSQITQQSTISRFACRILVDRKPPYVARIYAAGFDSSKNIFLGEKATKWQHNGEIDGLTTNGVLICHPKVPFYMKAKDDVNSKRLNLDKCCKQNDQWREVSVCGSVYAIRETRSASTKGEKIENETNILQDGTLIDLCGATLIWRSAEGLCHSPTKRVLEEMIDEMNAARPLCPVGLNTLVIPRRNQYNSEANREPYVYLVCGHVQGLHHWGIMNQTTNSESRKCPVCLRLGRAVKLNSGCESSFCVDKQPPTYAFCPCAHMASENTVKTWASISIPIGINGFRSICPFCATALDVNNPYVKLIFQDHVD